MKKEGQIQKVGEPDKERKRTIEGERKQRANVKNRDGDRGQDQLLQYY